jgi:sarcosine oxidase subunit gamma
VSDILLEPGRHGMPDGRAGVTVRVVTGVALATLAISEIRGGDAPAVDDGITLIGTGPGRWLAIAEDRDEAAGLEAALRRSGVVTDQSDAYVILDLSGPDARRTLAKGVALDLHPSVFPVGSSAVTMASHIGVTIWLTDAAPTFRLAVPRSYAASFIHWLKSSAAEFGLNVLPDR